MSEQELFYEINALDDRAAELLKEGRPRDALRIYTFMADGDRSLDSGQTAQKIGRCYEVMGEPYMAKYWYGRAIEEAGAPDPALVPDAVAGLARLDKAVSLDDLIAPELYIYTDERKCWEASRRHNIERARKFDAAQKAGKEKG